MNIPFASLLASASKKLPTRYTKGCGRKIAAFFLSRIFADFWISLMKAEHWITISNYLCLSVFICVCF